MITSRQQITSPLNFFFHRNTFGVCGRAFDKAHTTKRRNNYSTPVKMAPKKGQTSQHAIDLKKRCRATIQGLFHQFEDNETLQRTCTASDSLSRMERLCTVTQERYNDQTVEDQWSHIINILNEAFVDRIYAKGTATNHPPLTYNLKPVYFRDALKAAKFGTVDLARLSTVANRLDLATNSDGIMTRRHATSSPGQAQANAVEAASAGLSATNRRRTRSDNAHPPNAQPSIPASAPSGPIAVAERQLHDTYFNVPKYADLTIALKDRPVYVSRIMLCRASAHFAELLEDRAQVCRTQQQPFIETNTKSRVYKSSSTKTTQKP